MLGMVDASSSKSSLNRKGVDLSIQDHDIVYKFDGDVLNVMHIISQPFFERCNVVFNPRNAMYISRIDGKLNPDMLVQRDTLINANTFIYLGRKNYSKAQLDHIKKIKEKQKEYYNQDN